MRASLLVLLVLALASAAVPFAHVRSQAEVASGTAPLSMGFGPGVLSPISQGVPIYAAGDQIWLMSDSQDQFRATLNSPEGAALISAEVTSGGPSLLFAFSPYDPAGTWSISVVDQSQPSLSFAPIPILLVGDDLSPPALTDYALSPSGQLQLDFDVSSTSQYDLQECAVGSAVPDVLAVPLPAGVGSGQLLVGKNGTQASVSAQGILVSPFNFWMELDQNYSYYLGSPSTVVSRDVTVAATQAVSIIPGASSVNASFYTYAQIRTGRFALRAFFDTPSGLSVAQEMVMIPNDGGGWISLSGCSASADVSSTTFSLSSSLGTNSSTWPTVVYTMYQSEGVDLVAETVLDLMPAVITVLASPWEIPLTDTQLKFTPGPGVQQTALGDGTLYLVASQYPVQVGVSLTSGQTQEVVIRQPFTTARLQVNSSRVTVETYQDGSLAPGVLVSVLAGNETVASSVSASGQSTFYLPEGNYNVSAALGGETQVRGFYSLAGRSSVISMYFTSHPNDESLYALLATATVGAMASALVWIKVYRDRR